MDKSKPHVIFIAYYFPPAQEIGGSRPFRLHKYLKRMGYPCHVITASQPAEPAPAEVLWVPDNLAPVWDGKSKEKLGHKGRFELLLRTLMFPGHLGLAWSFEVAHHCRQIIRAHPGQTFVLFTTFPPLGVLLAGLMIRWRDKTPWISDFRDPMEVNPKNQHISRWPRFCNSLLERAVFRAADSVIANTQAAADMLTTRFPRARSKTQVIWNGFDPEAQPHARELPDRREKIIVHAGALYFARNPNLIIESLSRLWKAGLPQVRQACVTLVGTISQVDLKTDVYDEGQREGWLQLRPPVSKAEAQRIIEEADGLLLVQPQSEVQVPGKLFDYICIGRPILALVPRNSAVEYVLRNAGVPYTCIYADDNPETTDQKLLSFLSLPTQPTPYSYWFRTNFNAVQQAGQLATFIEAIV